MELISKPALLIFLVLNFSLVFAQNGNIEGVISDKKTGETLVGATVLIENTTNGVITNFDGYFKLSNLKQGKYNIKVSYIAYNPIVYENVEVKAGNTTLLNSALDEATININEVVVKAVRVTNTEMSMITSIKSNNLVVTGISSQQISKTQDKDASEVVRRIPGITIMGDRFVVVRGLNERYNTVWLNNASTPSSESDQRAFSFDVIPSNVLDNILIYKTTAPELPADFSGGFINIVTKNIPDKTGFNIQYGSSINSQSTFNPTYDFDAGKSNFLGFHNSKQNLPSNFPADLRTFYDYEKYPDLSSKQIMDTSVFYTRELNNNWKSTTFNAPVDQKISIGFNFRHDIGQLNIGSVTALNYSKSYSNITTNKIVFGTYRVDENTVDISDQYSDTKYTTSNKAGLIHNWCFVYKNNKIDFKNFFNLSDNLNTTTRNGKDGYNNYIIKSAEMKYQSKRIYSGQLGGDHKLFDNSTHIDWTFGYSNSYRNEPDIRRFKQIRDEYDTTLFYTLVPSTGDLSSISRFFINLNENLYSWNLNVQHTFNFNGYKPELKLGMFIEKNERDYNSRSFGYKHGPMHFDMYSGPVDSILGPANINDSTGLFLVEGTDKSDSYKASNVNNSAYISFKVPIGQRISVYLGVRAEHNIRKLNSFEKASDAEINVNRDTIEWLPSINTTFNFTENSLVRFAYGKSINRPEYREIAPMYYLDFDKNAGVSGNPSLKQANIDNYDLRFEWYPTPSEIVNVGFFYKKFKNPIEVVIVNAAAPLIYSFNNPSLAESYGSEIDIRKSIDSWIKNFYIVFNASYINSSILFSEIEKEKKLKNRPMQGQSAYIINTGLFYQNPKSNLIVSLLYNRIGKRIFAVGETGEDASTTVPDIYEMPRNLFDFTISKKLTKYLEIKGGIKDILNEDVQFQQIYESVKSDGTSQSLTKISRRYSPGRLVSLGLTANF